VKRTRSWWRAPGDRRDHTPGLIGGGIGGISIDCTSAENSVGKPVQFGWIDAVVKIGRIGVWKGAQGMAEAPTRQDPLPVGGGRPRVMGNEIGHQIARANLLRGLTAAEHAPSRVDVQ